MRRQVKPFVTEYRGAARRQKDQPGSVDLPPEAQPLRPRPSSEAQRVFGSDGPDASYEAALRAADALFAAPTRKTPKADPPSPPAADPDPWATGPAPAAPRPATPTADDPGEVASGSAVVGSEKGGTPPGRILQAIETPVEDRFAALEAERAPKRRGRKPGSKNKPKPSIGDDWLAGQNAPARRATADVPRPVFAFAEEPTEAEPTALPAFAEEGSGAGGATSPLEGLPAATMRVRNDRFGWKRYGLRPGERWKRRLPKTAW